MHIHCIMQVFFSFKQTVKYIFISVQTKSDNIKLLTSGTSHWLSSHQPGLPFSLVLLLTESNSQAVNSGQIYKSHRAHWAQKGHDVICRHLALGSMTLFQTQVELFYHRWHRGQEEGRQRKQVHQAVFSPFINKL